MCRVGVVLGLANIGQCVHGYNRSQSEISRDLWTLQGRSPCVPKTQTKRHERRDDRREVVSLPLFCSLFCFNGMFFFSFFVMTDQIRSKLSLNGYSFVKLIQRAEIAEIH